MCIQARPWVNIQVRISNQRRFRSLWLSAKFNQNLHSLKEISNEPISVPYTQCISETHAGMYWLFSTYAFHKSQRVPLPMGVALSYCIHINSNPFCLLLNYVFYYVINLCTHTDAFWRLSSRQLLKTLWQEANTFIMSTFTYCHHVFNFIKYLFFELLSVPYFAYRCW